MIIVGYFDVDFVVGGMWYIYVTNNWKSIGRNRFYLEALEVFALSPICGWVEIIRCGGGISYYKGQWFV